VRHLGRRQPNSVVLPMGSFTFPGGAARVAGDPRLGRPLVALASSLLTLLAILALAAPAARAAGDANMSSCPQATEESPGFRAYLPDCRAYELVSPPYTGGYEVYGNFESTNANARISASGESAEGNSLGSFAGSENSWISTEILGTPYRFQRGQSGWSSEGTIPTHADLPSPMNVDASADLSRSVWISGSDGNFQLEQTEPRRLFVREPDGDFVLVGPLTPVYEFEAEGFLGASADLGRLVTRIGASAEAGHLKPYWPGDDTLPEDPGHGAHRNSLYEYAGRDISEPALIGVKNTGTIAAAAARQGKAHINEAAELITQCGTGLGYSPTDEGNFGHTFNAVSPSGYGVFFTAFPGGCTDGVQTGTGPAAAELYLRVEGEETVALSEPTYPSDTECTGPCAIAEQKAGEFAGASEDGHTVFFTTEQPLLNSDEDSANDLYMERIAGEGTSARVSQIVQVSRDPTAGQPAEVQGVVRVAADGDRVYFVAKGVLTAQSNGNGETAELGQSNLYVYDQQTGAVAFVAKLVESDEALWGSRDLHEAQASRADGRYLLFVSEAHPMNTGDTSGAGQLFRYDASSGELARVSVGKRGEYLCSITDEVERGFNCNGNVASGARAPKIRQPNYISVDSADAPFAGINITPEGTVFFESTASLTPEAQNGYPTVQPGYKNIYEYRDGEIYLITDGVETPVGYNAAGTGQQKVAFLGATPDGGALFYTADSLVPQDTGSQVSIYDARTDGGFPGVSANQGCVGDACRNGASGPGQEGSVATTSTQTLGNVPAPKKKPKKKHNHKKKQSRKKKHSHKAKKGNSRSHNKKKISDARPMGTRGAGNRRDPESRQPKDLR
jgi:hypothetical protein